MKQTIVSSLLCACILALFSLAWLPSDVSARSSGHGGGMGWSGSSGNQQAGGVDRVRRTHGHVGNHQSGGGALGIPGDYPDDGYGDDGDDDSGTNGGGNGSSLGGGKGGSSGF